MSELIQVPFHGDTLEACGTCPEDAQVSIRRVCDALGVASQSQLEKLKGKAWATVTMIVAVAEDGKQREQAMIALKSLPMWLATIDPRKVSEHVREKLARYQQEAHDVLAAHFLKLKPPAADPNALTAVLAPLVEAVTQLKSEIAELRAGQSVALQLTISQKSMIAAQMVGTTQTKAAKLMGVSERSVRNANRVRRDLPALVPAVTQGKIDVKTASEVAKMSTRAELVLRADNPKAAAKQLLACSC
jgi:DNA-binding transcriptional regulator YdaS (Cro superfamily)